MDRFQIKEMRDIIESNGFFVEYIDDDYIMVSHLKDNSSKHLKVFANHKCPKCNSYMSYDSDNKEYLCLNKECMHQDFLLTPPEAQEIPKEKMYKQLVLSCKASDCQYMNQVLEEICEIVDNWCEVYLEYVGDPVHPESTLGLAED